VIRWFSLVKKPTTRVLVVGFVSLGWSGASGADRAALPPLSQRFAPNADGQCATSEIPDFQKHVSPLLGRMGCNGRACHGSFQGRGGFLLSLFGYDFKADHQALMDHSRVDPKAPLDSLILNKPTSDEQHEGGQVFKPQSWEYWVLRKWIEAGAPGASEDVEQRLQHLEVLPPEIVQTDRQGPVALRVRAHWSDGTVEDVTQLCRFHTNDSSIATVDSGGLVSVGETGDTHVVVSFDKAVMPIPVIRPIGHPRGTGVESIASTAAGGSLAEPRTEIDRLISIKHHKMGLVPSDLCTDEEFLRRASIDISGTIPTPTQVRQFVSDPRPDKRQRVIDELLETPGYAQWWATYFCDLTGNNDEQLKNFSPRRDTLSKQWYHWLAVRLADNVPYDKIVEGIVTAVSREPGESYAQYCDAMSKITSDDSGKLFAQRSGLAYYWARNNQKTPEERAVAFAYTFLGVRIQCAQCHKHPFDQWSKNDFEHFERLFEGIIANQNSMMSDAKPTYDSLLKELGVAKSLKGNDLRKELTRLLTEGKTVPFPEMYVNSVKNNGKDPKDKKDKNNKNRATAAKGKLLGDQWIDLRNVKDPRDKLMAWLRQEDNPYFAKAIVNRIWAHYLGVGIINPADDLNLANAPSNQPLLQYLADGFTRAKFDLKWLHREITRSDAYQRSWRTNETNAQDQRNFSHALLRRVPAEVAYDAIQMATSRDQIVDQWCSGSSPRALTLGGSSPRGVQGSGASYALSVFGRSTRETNCDCDRSNAPSLLQTVYVRNDVDVLRAIRDPKNGWIAQVAEKTLAQAAEKASATAREQNGRDSSSANVPAEPTTTDILRSRIEKMKARGVNESVLEKLKIRLKQLEAAEGTRSSADESAEPGPGSLAVRLDPGSIDGWIDEAYLRSLSRFPTGEEREVARKSIHDGHYKLESLADLVWALINTKEFVLNH
jgi:hypothetical protein